MKIIIIGCGKAGRQLIYTLTKENNDITIIDTNPVTVNEMSSSTDVLGITGNGASNAILTEAGIAHADILIATTGSDELNLLCCVVARKSSKCSLIARIRNPVYQTEIDFIQKRLDIAAIINPEMSAAAEIASLVRFPNAIEVDAFYDGKVDLVKFRVDAGSRIVGLKLSELGKKIKCDILVCLVVRDHQAIIPKGDYKIEANDLITFIATKEKSFSFFRKISDVNKVHDVMIAGGGAISIYLAEELIKFGISMKIIERNKARCEHLSEALPEAQIICADASQLGVLQEERIDKMDAFIALTGIDEENILLSVSALDIHNEIKTITKINHTHFAAIVGRLSLDSIINPPLITAEKIMRFVRSKHHRARGGSNIASLHRLDGDAEALEFILEKDFTRSGIPIMKLPIHPDVLIAHIHRNGNSIIPGGNDSLFSGDSVIIITTRKGIEDIDGIWDLKS